MAGLIVAGIVAAALPGVVSRLRVLSIVLALSAVVMVAITPSALSVVNAGGDPPTSQATTPRASSSVTATPGATAASATPKPVEKGGTSISADPRRNFRLYLLVAVLPWAATQEPLLGFGPGEQVAANPDPRLAEFVGRSGLKWSQIVPYMNDSQYASLVIQFGVLITGAFLALLLSCLAGVARAAVRSTEALPRFAALFGLVALVAAALGPFFETRTDSIVLWVPLLVALGAVRARTVREPIVGDAASDDLPRQAVPAAASRYTARSP
jgi:hypothetical protein